MQRIRANEKESFIAKSTRSFSVFLNLTLLVASFATNAFAKSPYCSEVGGAILTNVGGFGQINGRPTTLGVATGDFERGQLASKSKA